LSSAGFVAAMAPWAHRRTRAERAATLAGGGRSRKATAGGLPVATPQLAIVPSPDPVETPGQRLRRLKQESRQAAIDQVSALVGQLAALDQMAREIFDGGDVYPV